MKYFDTQWYNFNVKNAENLHQTEYPSIFNSGQTGQCLSNYQYIHVKNINSGILFLNL